MVVAMKIQLAVTGRALVARATIIAPGSAAIYPRDAHTGVALADITGLDLLAGLVRIGKFIAGGEFAAVLVGITLKHRSALVIIDALSAAAGIEVAKQAGGFGLDALLIGLTVGGAAKSPAKLADAAVEVLDTSHTITAVGITQGPAGLGGAVFVFATGQPGAQMVDTAAVTTLTIIVVAAGDTATAFRQAVGG